MNDSENPQSPEEHNPHNTGDGTSPYEAPKSALPEAPTSIPQEEKTMGMAAHLASLAGCFIPFGHLIGPLIVWIMKKDTMPFVDDQGKESLNFQLSMTIYLAVAGLSIFLFIGLLLFPVVAIADIVLTIIAGIAANEGKAYRYPFTIRFIK